MATEMTGRHETMASDRTEKTNGNMVPRKRHEELQYLDLVQEILANGEHRPDRYEVEVYLERDSSAIFST
jgi:hypothetical protein